MDPTEQAAKAEVLRKLHTSGTILVLPNVWDVASARLVEKAGAKAIATSSAGIAFSLGYPDGQRISSAEMVDQVERIAQAVALPVSADFEAGYGESVASVVSNVQAVIRAGAVGINFEDGKGHDVAALESLEAQMEKIKAIREAAASMGMALVINARTDVYLSKVGEPETRFDHAVHRANAYRDAGADCLFVPGVLDAETIGRLTRSIRGPVNILAGPGCPSIPELQKLGVARVSVGSKPFCAAMDRMQHIAREMLESGTFAFLESEVNHASMTKLLQ